MMRFYRPVDERFPILHQFAEWGSRWGFVVDPQNSLWLPRSSEPGTLGQHRGVDFDCPKGSLVTAVADGMIVKALYENALDYKVGSGFHVIQLVSMPGFDAWWVRYSHLKDCYHKVGTKILRGQPLGESGASGNVEVPLLHVDLMDTRHQFHPFQWQ